MIAPSKSLPSETIVLAGDAQDVKDVLGDHAGVARAARAAEKLRGEDDADGAARVRHRLDLRVGQVPPVRPHTGDTGVRDDQRLAAIVAADGFPERLRVDVRQVDEDTPRVELGDRLPPARGEALAAAGPPSGLDVAPYTAFVRCTSVARTIPSSGSDHTPSGAPSQRIESLDRQQAGVRPARPRRAIAGDVRTSTRAPAERAMRPRSAARFRWKVRQRAAALRNGLVVIDHIAPSRPPSQHSRKIEMPEEVPPERPGLVACRADRSPTARAGMNVSMCRSTSSQRRVSCTASTEHPSARARSASSRGPVIRAFLPAVSDL